MPPFFVGIDFRSVRFAIPLSTSAIIGKVCWVDSFDWRYAGISAWRKVFNNFREHLKMSLRNFKGLLNSKSTSIYYFLLNVTKFSLNMYNWPAYVQYHNNTNIWQCWILHDTLTRGASGSIPLSSRIRCSFVGLSSLKASRISTLSLYNINDTEHIYTTSSCDNP